MAKRRCSMFDEARCAESQLDERLRRRIDRVLLVVHEAAVAEPALMR